MPTSSPRKLEAPDGYMLFGWWVSSGGIQAQVRESAIHLLRDDDPKARRAVCGRVPRARGANLERPATFTFGYDDRRICLRCFARADALDLIPDDDP
jgi:hypothetical protein